MADLIPLTNLIPLKENIIVINNDQEETKTASWFILPEAKHKEKPINGTIKAVWSEVTDLKPGDIVYFTKYTPNEIELDDQIYLVMDQSSVLAKVDSNA